MQSCDNDFVAGCDDNNFVKVMEWETVPFRTVVSERNVQYQSYNHNVSNLWEMALVTTFVVTVMPLAE